MIKSALIQPLPLFLRCNDELPYAFWNGHFLMKESAFVTSVDQSKEDKL